MSLVLCWWTVIEKGTRFTPPTRLAFVLKRAILFKSAFKGTSSLLFSALPHISSSCTLFFVHYSILSFIFFHLLLSLQSASARALSRLFVGYLIALLFFPLLFLVVEESRRRRKGRPTDTVTLFPLYIEREYDKQPVLAYLNPSPGTGKETHK